MRYEEKTGARGPAPMGRRAAGSCTGGGSVIPCFRGIDRPAGPGRKAMPTGTAAGRQCVPASGVLFDPDCRTAAVFAHHGAAGFGGGIGAFADFDLRGRTGQAAALHPGASLGGSAGGGIPAQHCRFGDAEDESAPGAADDGLCTLYICGLSQPKELWNAPNRVFGNCAGRSAGEPLWVLAEAAPGGLSDGMAG